MSVISEPVVGVAESGVLAPGWAGTGADLLVSDAAFVRAMIDVEAALARAQAALGVIPARAVPAIETACRAGDVDLAALADGVRATANPVVGLVGQLTARVAAIDESAAEYVHRGCTSQDVLDSALMLLAARALSTLDDELTRCADGLAGLAAAHRDTPMAGRTLTQHAVPVTFGLKAAGWLDLVLDARDRVRRLTVTGLPASIGGAAGTLAAYAEYARLAGAAGDGAVELIEPFAAELGLRAPSVPWHGNRTPLADLAGTLATVTGALGKIAVDVQVLTRTEIGEVAEPSAAGRGASSAMPQKHNPVFATLVLTAARQLPGSALTLFQSMVAEDERSAGAWHAEWQPLRECLRLSVGAAANLAELVCGLRVFPDRMLANLRSTGGAVVSERLNAALAPRLGKATAKKLLTAAVDAAAESGTELADVLDGLLRESGHPVDVAELRDLLDPTRYTGAAAALTDRVLHRHRLLAAPAAPQST